MKEKPILFRAHEVRATLDGRQTQLRRIMSNQPVGRSIGPVYVRQVGDGFQWHGEAGESSVFLCPYGKPGDRLWVREKFGKCDGGEIAYYANDDLLPKKFQGWKPSIHMPRWASRITLEVVSVRVERLQDISEADAKAEGLSCEFGIDEVYCTQCSGHERLCLQNRFRTLWESINGPGSWEANPWVWVITFKLITPTTP